LEIESWNGWLLDGAEGQALDEFVLGGEAGEQHREGDDDGGRADLGEEQALADETKPVRKTGAVPAMTPVRTRARRSSFQLKMKQISAVAAMPGMATGATILRRVRSRPAPSIWAASSISSGTSARKERIIQTAMGRFMEVYIRIRNQMLSRAPVVFAKR
jgi:hypothetical protein